MVTLSFYIKGQTLKFYGIILYAYFFFHINFPRAIGWRQSEIWLMNNEIGKKLLTVGRSKLNFFPGGFTQVLFKALQP